MRQLRELQKVPNEPDHNKFTQALLDNGQVDGESDETKPPQAQMSETPDVATSDAQVVIPSGTPRGISGPQSFAECGDPSTSTSRDDIRSSCSLHPAQRSMNHVTGSA